MEYVNLGSTGLRVSRVCLGMMSYGAHESRPWALAEADAEPIIRRAVEGGITFFDTADVYNGGQSEVVTGRVLPKLLSREELVDRDEGARPDDARRERPRPVAQARDGLDRRLAAAAADGLRRPVPDPPLGLHDADRGDDGGAARRREGGQGALHRREQHVRVAVREGAGGGRAPRLDAVRLDAEPRQPRLPRGGAGDDPAVHRPGRRRPAVEPARARPARRGTAPAPASASRPAPEATRSATRSTCPESTSTSSTVSSRSPPARGVPSAQVALAWLLGKPGVTAPIVGATKVAHVEDALAAEQLELTADEVDAAGGAVRAARGLRARVAPDVAVVARASSPRVSAQPRSARRRVRS